MGAGPRVSEGPPVTHKCAAAGCGLVIDRGLLMCRDHWFMVPAPIRRAVWRGWRAGGVLDAGYQAAVAAAVKAVADRQQRP